MRVKITELRDMVAEAVRASIAEAKRKKAGGGKKKDIPSRTVDAELQRREKATKALPGFAHADNSDFSQPLGPKSLPKRQGNFANFGGYTTEQRLRGIIDMIVAEEIVLSRGKE